AQAGVLLPSTREAHHMMNSMKSGSVHPTQIATFLDLFVADQRCIPSDASPVTKVDELPRNLQRIAGKAPANEGWRAWTDKDGRIWFVRGKVSNTFSRRTSRTAMHVFF